MKQMVSSVSTIQYPQRVALGETFKNSNRQQTTQAAPSLAMAGVPGEYDFRKFLTGAFQNMIPVQVGNSSTVVGTIAYSTNKNQALDFDPGRFTGPYVPAGGYAYPALPDVPTRYIPPNRVVVTNPSTASVFSTKVVQETDIY